MKKIDEQNFFNIVSDIIVNPEYINLRNEKHHGISRFDHSIRVAKFTYRMTKYLKVDQVAATRGAMLHDFYTMAEVDQSGKKGSCIHPLIAAENAQKYYNLSKRDINIIESHMFPLGKVLPKSKEAWLVDAMDTAIATYELTKFKLNGAIALYILFFINLIIFKK